MAIFIVRTTAGRERQVAEIIAMFVQKEPGSIKAILNPEMIRGYVFVESDNIEIVKQAIYGMHHVKGVINEPVSVESLKQFITAAPKQVVVKEGDIVELISGPFKGEKAKVKRLNKVKEEVVVELLEAAVPIPMNVSIDSIRVIQSSEGEAPSMEEQVSMQGMNELPSNIRLIKKGSNDNKEGE